MQKNRFLFRKALGISLIMAMTACTATDVQIQEKESYEEVIAASSTEDTPTTNAETDTAEQGSEAESEASKTEENKETDEEVNSEDNKEENQEDSKEDNNKEDNNKEDSKETGTDEMVWTDDVISFVADMQLGWNLGNTLDATDGSGLNSEVSWGQPYTTKELIDYVKECGFSTIRIPVSWSKHMDSNGTIDAAWMDRVTQVVDWALADDFYVIINSHHDNDSYYPRDIHMEKSKDYLTKAWTQIADHFKDYDQRLIFESMNEPRLAGTDKEWWFQPTDADGIAAIGCVVELNQLFVDLVRSSGGNNDKRFLMVPSVCASPDNAFNSVFSMPVDPSEKLILSIHAYTPYDFTMNDNGYSYWNESKKGEMNFLTKLKTQFMDKGYGVVVGEFGATNKDNLEARVAWAKDYRGKASSLGIPCILWDNGLTQIGNENFGMIDRTNLKVFYPELLEALLHP